MRLRGTMGPMTFVVAGWLAMAPAAAQTGGACADLGAAGSFIAGLAADGTGAGAEAVCEEIVGLQARASAAEAQAAELRAALELAQEAAPPAGSILLVDDGRGCPAGWTDVALAEPEVFAGRTPLAVGFAEERVFRGYRQVGGSEAVALTEGELPAHAHALPLGFEARRDGSGTRSGSSLGSGFASGSSLGDQVAVRTLAGREQTGRAGAGAPHDNMPPFVALFWCRKD